MLAYTGNVVASKLEKRSVASRHQSSASNLQFHHRRTLWTATPAVFLSQIRECYILWCSFVHRKSLVGFASELCRDVSKEIWEQQANALSCQTHLQFLQRLPLHLGHCTRDAACLTPLGAGATSSASKASSHPTCGLRDLSSSNSAWQHGLYAPINQVEAR